MEKKDRQGHGSSVLRCARRLKWCGACALCVCRPLPYVWQMLTASFYEMGPISVLFNAAVILQVGRTVEPIWGSRETAKYILAVGLTHQTVMLFASVFLFMKTRSAKYLYSPMGGFHGVSASFTVVVKQLFPDASLPNIPLRGACIFIERCSKGGNSDRVDVAYRKVASVHHRRCCTRLWCCWYSEVQCGTQKRVWHLLRVRDLP